MQIDLSQLITAEDKLAAAWASLRADRDARLAACDWTVLLDATPKPSLQDWLEYRQALRDITDGIDNPKDAVWPMEPAAHD